MATFQVLYWQEIPSQIKAWDDFDETRIELGPEFVARIDAAAQAKGLTSADDYLAQWKWSDEEEREGDAEAVAQNIKAELETKFGK
jgi:hypothetical protein